MKIYSLYKDGVYVCSFQFKAGVAAYLNVKSHTVQTQFRRKGFYMKHNIRVIEDVLR